MANQRKQRRWFWILGGGLLGLVVIWRLLFLVSFSSPQPPEWGVTFSPIQTDYLELDGPAVYRAMLDDLGVRQLRLAAYWNRLEPIAGTYDFSELDYYLDEAAKRNAQVILAVGRRLPRWPECHDPEWVADLSVARQQLVLRDLMVAVVKRYRSHSALKMWQVENEPFLHIFGQCPAISRETVKQEVSLVKAIDPHHPVLVTDSGELSTWLRSARLADYLGSTFYRVVWHTGFPVSGKVSHEQTIPLAMYPLKAWLVGLPRSRMLLIEIQAEAWAPDGITKTSLADQFSTMDIDRFKRIITSAPRTGFPGLYLWGVEWWYWLAQHNHPEFWDYAKTVFR